MQVTTIDIKSQLWREILQEIPHDTYHLPNYLELEARRTKSIPEACVICEDEQIFFATYLIRKCDDITLDDSPILEGFDVISPYGYAGILINQAAASSPKFIADALACFKDTLKSKGICSAFFRLHPILNTNLIDIFPENTFTPNGQTVSIDLTLSEAELWAHTRKGHQSTINKCKRLGLTARMVSPQEYYDQFLDIYTETMNRVNASESYYFNDQYFQDLLSLDEKLHLCVVESESEIICASLFFECCGIVQAHLGGTKSDFLRQSPFNLLLHHVRLWAKERGNEYLHIGGGVGGSTDDSLFTFKSGFSRQRHEFFTARLITDEKRYFELVEMRAKILDTESDKLIQSGFFPAYRAS
jgi:Acetyltransferase (GNAT) domain